ncbi:similar to Saccharomyces cerevisiae YFR011C AIM13 Putative protein of unknown function [Maudiozyma saulgeensis]|uniref:MICOS complex subunit MIC19 n=1 Tax=Maudiozyma saulgeensis TaxID=1789683 RepID=A0A1X7R1B8_9SACH|nr:similar to Saccharomyces cerevisiae YFR011C AIM13 Putative protein of unknown function [Kazachstania saulgeensis]
MGAQASRPSLTDITPDIKFDASEETIKRLGGTETDFAKREDAERFIESKISERLLQLERETLKKFEDKLDKSLLLTDVDVGTLSSKSLDEKMDALNLKIDLYKQLDSDKRKDFTEKDKENVEKKLTECLIKNKGKPLNCFEIMEQFKKLTSE